LKNLKRKSEGKKQARRAFKNKIFLTKRIRNEKGQLGVLEGNKKKSSI